MTVSAAVTRPSVDVQGVRAVRLGDEVDEDSGATLLEPGHEALAEALLGGRAAGGAVVHDGPGGGHDVVLDADGCPVAQVGRPGPRSAEAGQGPVQLLGIPSAEGDGQAGRSVAG